MEDKKHIIKICIDKSRSHVQGLLPYVRYDEDDSSAQFVNGSDPNGNWGGFPYDIAKTSRSIGRGEDAYYGITYQTKPRTQFKGNHESRLRYCDIMLRYNRIQEALRNAILTKAVIKKVEDDETRIIGKQTGSIDGTCNYQISPKDVYDEIHLSTRFPEAKTKYEFTPMPSSDFTKVNDVLYLPNEGITVQEGEFIALLDNYSAFIDAETWWNDWWREWYGNGESSTAWTRYYHVEMDAYWFCRIVEKHFIGKVLVPEVFNGNEITGIRVPDYVYYSEVQNLIKWFDDRLDSAKKNVKREVEEHGGKPFYNFLKSLTNEAEWISRIPTVQQGEVFSYAVPFVSFPITLEDEHEYSGLYETYADASVVKDFNERQYLKEFSAGTEITRWIENPGCYVESQLVEVMDEDATEVDGITGVWTTFSGGPQIFKCTFHTGNPSNTTNRIVKVHNGWWECAEYSGTITCGDGEDVRAGQAKYRSVTILDCIKNVVGNANNGDVYYFLAKKDNGYLNGAQTNIRTFGVPYKKDAKIHNLRSIEGETDIYMGDFIDIINDSQGIWTIEYVIGGLFTTTNATSYIPKTGVRYRESYPITKKQSIITFMDGSENVQVFYDALDMDSYKTVVYSEEYGLFRKANRAEVIGMEVGTMFNEDRMIMAPIFTKEGSSSFIDDPKKVFDITFNRGAAAAFESHFKLSECNTFEDLKNYGNNHFNL